MKALAALCVSTADLLSIANIDHTTTQPSAAAIPRRKQDKMNAKKIADMKSFNTRYYGKCKGTNKDYQTVYEDFCRDDGDYTRSHATALYNRHSAEYCGLLFVLTDNYSDHREPCRYKIMQSGLILSKGNLELSFLAERDDYSLISFTNWITLMIDQNLLQRVPARGQEATQ